MFCNDNWRICCCSASQSCPTLCDTMDCNTPGFPVLHYLPEFAQTHVRWVGVAIQPSHPLLPPSPPALHLSQHQGLKRPWLFASGGQSIGALASASSLPMNIQGWFPLELTSLTSCVHACVCVCLCVYTCAFGGGCVLGVVVGVKSCLSLPCPLITY